jgi:hypothetical protein
MDELGEHRTNAMNGLMSIEALSHEALCGALHRYSVAESDLVLDHDVQHGVQLFIREPNTRPTMIIQRKTNALCFIDREPLFGLGSFKGIVLYQMSPANASVAGCFRPRKQLSLSTGASEGLFSRP